MSTGRTDLYFKLEDSIGTKDDMHIDMELPPDGTMSEEMLQSEEEPIVLEESWVADKYGEESAMDTKKEVDLQWLIDKKKGGDNA